MLSNEQRAHDLALSLTMWKVDHINGNIDKSKMQRDANGNYIAKIDIYAMYKQEYTNFLNAINRDFPVEE